MRRAQRVNRTGTIRAFTPSTARYVPVDGGAFPWDSNWNAAAAPPDVWGDILFAPFTSHRRRTTATTTTTTTTTASSSTTATATANATATETATATTVNSRRVTLNYDCAINVISFFDKNDVGSLFNTALVNKQFAAVALRALWGEPMLLFLRFDSWGVTTSFVTTLISCMGSDAQRRLVRAGLVLPPGCYKTPTFPYAAFVRLYKGEAACKIADDWAELYTTHCGVGWSETANVLMQELENLILGTGALRCLELDMSSSLPPPILNQNHIRDWKLQQLAHMCTYTDEMFDDWNKLLADACSDLRSIQVTASPEESDCEKVVQLISAQRRLETLSLIGTSSEWGKRESPFRKLLACAVEKIRHVTVFTKKMSPLEIQRHANVRSVQCFTGEHTFGFYVGVHLHPFQCTLAAVGPSFQKLSIEHREHNKPICESLEMNCPLLRELRITVRQTQNMSSFESLLKNLRSLEVLQLVRFPTTSNDALWDNTLVSLRRHAGGSFRKVVFDGPFRFSISGARDFMKWSSGRRIQIVWDTQVAVRSNKKALFPAERHLKDYIRRRHLSIRTAEELRKPWESDEVLGVVIQ